MPPARAASTRLFWETWPEESPRLPPTRATPLLLSQGICLSRYFERFGGFGQTRDLALIAFQVALAMDAMQAGRLELAQDHLALLAVSLEQASLDGGRMDLAYQLTWLEEPPAGMYANPTASGILRNRPFAPLASQRWMTVVLGYLKEMEVIQSRRADNRPAQGFSSWVRSAARRRRPSKAKAPSSKAEEGPPGLAPPASAVNCKRPSAEKFGSPGAGVSGFQGQPEAPSTAHVKDTLCTTITFAGFAASLPRWILRSRTGFGAYLASVFSLPLDRRGVAPPSATFPLPLPYLGLFQCLLASPLPAASALCGCVGPKLHP